MLDVARAMGGALLFSDRAKTVCTQFHIQKEVVWSPVEITYRDKRKDSYWAITCSSRGRDGLDLDRSELTWDSSRKIIFSIDRWVLDGKRLPNLDLFLLEEHWIVSAAFRDAFVAEGLTGAVFHPCEVS
jgi:hypothetical protein